MRLWLLTTLAAVVLTLGACKSDEGFFKAMLKDLDEEAAKADPKTKVEILKMKAELEAAFKKLPKGEGRADAVDELGTRAYNAVNKAEEMVEEAAKTKASARAAVEQQATAEYRKPFTGVWRGDGMKLKIQADGKVGYERKKGASTRKVTGTISDFNKSSFKVKVLVASTTFKIDAPPREEVPGVWTMTIDGAKLYKIGMPGVKYVFGLKVCAKVMDSFCLGPRETYRNDETFNVIYDTDKVPKPGAATSLRWIAEKTNELPAERLMYDLKDKVEDLAKDAKDWTTGGFLKPPGPKGHVTGTVRVELRVGGELVAKKSFTVTRAGK